MLHVLWVYVTTPSLQIVCVGLASMLIGSVSVLLYWAMWYVLKGLKFNAFVVLHTRGRIVVVVATMMVPDRCFNL